MVPQLDGMTSPLNLILENWKFHRDLGLDALRSLPEGLLVATVGKGMGTLGEQFRHIGRVRQQYTEALRTGRIAPRAKKTDPQMAGSKDLLTAYLEKTGNELMEVLEGITGPEAETLRIDWSYWGGGFKDIPQHLLCLCDHENFHNGQMTVYFKTLGLGFPDSWKAWGL